MSKFAQWLTSKVAEKGGFDIVQGQLNCSSRNLAQWMAGAADPNIEGQLALAEAFGVEFAAVRDLLGAPCNPFSEWLSRKILMHGTIRDFCLRTYMSRSKIDKWLNARTVPCRFQYPDAPKELRRALRQWGDTTPPGKLLAEIEVLMDTAYLAKHGAKDNGYSKKFAPAAVKAQSRSKSKNKVALPCHFAKMA